ncbi:MAG: GNAT family N-acetyltransferase [Candidatus Solibacter usitatus]|nr:GNAT family N-acetyltransferase [Candidatus Solibacter usitatus]
MSLEFRTTTERDSPAVAAFIKNVFGITGDLPAVEPKHLHWKCWEEHPSWNGSHGFVMTQDEEIVAHVTAMPLTCRIEGREVRILHFMDWAAKRGTGAGMEIMRRAGESVDFVFAAGGTAAALKGLLKLGYRQCSPIACYARPLRPIRRLSANIDPLKRPSAWRTAAQVARSSMWKWKAPSLPVTGWTVRRLEGNQLMTEQFPLPPATSQVLGFKRSPEILRYFLKCPSTPMELFLIYKDGMVRGYFMLAYAPAQARIVDSWVDSTDTADWNILFELAVRQSLQHADVAEVVSATTDEFIGHRLLDCGFHWRANIPLPWRSFTGNVFPDTPLRFQMIDGDVAFLRTGFADFWG